MPRLVLAAVLTLAGCLPANGSESIDPSVPDAEAYERGSDFAGAWVGESNGVLGVLEVKSLGPGRYYGKFTSDDRLTKFVCNMQQPLVVASSGSDKLPGNLVRFSWQDGRGARGEGWVLINPGDSALTGEIRAGRDAGPWTFVRRDDPPVDQDPAVDAPPAAQTPQAAD